MTATLLELPPAELPLRRVTVLNSVIHAVRLEQAADEIVRWIRAEERGWVCTLNVAILMNMRKNPRLQRYVDAARLVVADGQPLVWLSGWRSTPLSERVAGIDLVESIAERSAREGFGIYFLGSTAKTLQTAIETLRRRHPAMHVCGYSDGYFSRQEAVRRADMIRRSGAHVLLAGMGVPRQEEFIEDHWDSLGVNAAIGVGGSFEVLAGLRRRAPGWMRIAGLEWLFRMLQEPRRLGRRYLQTNTQFIWAVLRQLWSR